MKARAYREGSIFAPQARNRPLARSSRSPRHLRPSAYLKQLGAPPDILLLKRVAAAGGDLVCARGGEVTAGRRVVTARGSDRRGRPLPSWRGCVRLKPHEIFLLGDTEASFDGRYFGPVSTREVAGVFTEAFTW